VVEKRTARAVRGVEGSGQRTATDRRNAASGSRTKTPLSVVWRRGLRVTQGQSLRDWP
jgi:hypothetical protein